MEKFGQLLFVGDSMQGATFAGYYICRVVEGGRSRLESFGISANGKSEPLFPCKCIGNAYSEQPEITTK